MATFVLARYDPRIPLYLHWLRMPNMQHHPALLASAQALAQTDEPESFRLVGAYLLDPTVEDWIKEEVAEYFHRNFSAHWRKSDEHLKEVAELLGKAIAISDEELAYVLQRKLDSLTPPPS
ncbi:hypothetical protein EON81_13700 [bacterium]|nr:MAG: hypothetical protein EON81_13700 [bacterium]